MSNPIKLIVVATVIAYLTTTILAALDKIGIFNYTIQIFAEILILAICAINSPNGH